MVSNNKIKGNLTTGTNDQEQNKRVTLKLFELEER